MKPDTRTWLVRGALLAAALIATLLAWQQLSNVLKPEQKHWCLMKIRLPVASLLSKYTSSLVPRNTKPEPGAM